MTIEDLQSICAKFKGMTEDIKWEDHLCFNIGGKMFLVTSPDRLPITASFKASEEDFNELTARDGFIPAPYMAKHKWVFVDNINRLSKKEWQYYARQAYELVGSKLSMKFKKSIGLAILLTILTGSMAAA
jgi:predicted DNA-binding protein (MmcQ/YjbR family)